MSFTMERQITVKYSFYAVREDICLFNQNYRKARSSDNPMDTCFVCGKSFSEQEKVTLLFSRDRTGNQVACKPCGIDIKNELSKEANKNETT